MTTQSRTYTLRSVRTFLIDVMGYSISDCNDYTYQEMLFIINDSGNLYNFQEFTK